MVTLNGQGRARRVSVIGFATAVLLCASVAIAGAQTTNAAASDRPAGYVVLPKVIVHTTGGVPPVLPGGVAKDTVIQITNTSETGPINLDCWWVDATNHCNGDRDEAACTTNSDCPLGLLCLPVWIPDDWSVTLTPGQPIGFTASAGLDPIPCDQLGQTGCIGVSEGFIPPAGDPFQGELKCVQVDVDHNPVVANNVKAEATIVTTVVGPIPPGGVAATTAAAYNGIGFEALEPEPPGSTTPTNVALPICLGRNVPPGATGPCRGQYAPCPSVLILNHFFERARPEIGGVVNTELTLVPCSEDLGSDTAAFDLEVVANMLVFNEFEQRFSTAARVQCYRSTTLADIDTLPGPSGDTFSIFASGVQGTLTGQTRIKGLQGAPGRFGYGLLGVACEMYRSTPSGPVLSTTAFNVHHTGFNANNDAVYLSPTGVPGP
jgi:hypothetical protein